MRKLVVILICLIVPLFLMSQETKRTYPENFDPSYSPPLKQSTISHVLQISSEYSQPPAPEVKGISIFYDDMESGINGWTSDGFMHLSINPQQNQVMNPTIHPNLVHLPDEGSLPVPKSGVSAWWYGEDATGTFIGSDFNPSQASLSGGTSTSSNTGSLISPLIDLKSVSSATLSFHSWWEIEGVDADRYDLMYVEISTDNGASFNVLGKLNPVNDYDGKPYIPFTLGGLGQPAQWSKHLFDLSQYCGTSVLLRFRFHTVDQLYNGFRGWFIDEVLVTTDNLEAPEISSVEPMSGNVESNFQITGQHFSGGAEVYMGSYPVHCSVINENEINCQVPDISIGTYDLMVMNTDGQKDTYADGFTVTDETPPQITSLTPTSTLFHKGVEITIEGTNISDDAQVTIGGKELLDMSVNNNVIIGFTPEDLSIGAHNVRIENPNGLYALAVNSFHVLPVMRVVSPNGSETLTSGLSYDVVYKINKDNTSGRLSYSLNNGFSWIKIHAFTDSDAGEYTFTWSNIPVVDSDHCLVKIQDSERSKTFDMSDATFTITKNQDIPNPPSNLHLVDKNLESVKISWKDNSNNETGFRVFRKESDVWQAVATTDADSYMDSQISGGKSYYYKVVAYNSSGESEYSNVLSVSVGNIPDPPDDLSLSVKSDSDIKLQWDDQSDNESGFRIERKTDNTDWKQIYIAYPNTHSYLDDGLGSGVKFYYRMKAYNDYGESGYSNTASAETGSIPNIPLNLSAKTLSSQSIELEWSDISDNEDGFNIYRRSPYSGGYDQIDQVNKNTESYEVDNLITGTTYAFKVGAFNKFGENVCYAVSAQTGSKPNKPSNVEARIYDGDKIKVTWDHSGTSNEKYVIKYIKDEEKGPYDLKDDHQYKSYIFYPKQEGASYKFQIQAENQYGLSNKAFSNSIEFNTGKFDADLVVRDKDGPVSGAEIWIKKEGSDEFVQYTADKVKENANKKGVYTLEDLELGDEILVRKEKPDLAYESNKDNHEVVDDKVFVVYFDNGEMDADGNYTYTKIDKEKSEYDVKLNHPVIGYNLVVSLDFNPSENEDFHAAFQNASELFYDIADGQMFLNKVYIFQNGKNFWSADMKVEDSYEVVRPNAHFFGIYKKGIWPIRDYRIKMDRFWDGSSLDGVCEPEYGLPQNENYYAAIIHEMGHYALGLKDEYLSGFLVEGDNWKYRENNIYKFPFNYGFMDEADYPKTSPTPYATEMSSWNDYNETYPYIRQERKISRQLSSRNLPCWQWVQDDFIEKRNGIYLTLPPYGYFEPGTDSWGQSIEGQDRQGPYHIPKSYDTEIIFDNKSSTKIKSKAMEAIVEDGNRIFKKSGASFKFLGKAYYGLRISIDENSELFLQKNNRYHYKTLHAKPSEIKGDEKVGIKEINNDQVSPGILVQTKLKQTEPTLLFDALFQFDINLDQPPEVNYYFSGNSGSVILTELADDKYIGTLQVDPKEETYDGTGYFEIMFTDTSGNPLTYIDKVTFEGLVTDEHNLVYNYRMFTIISKDILDEIRLMMINNTFGNPINAYNQKLIPFSEIYSFDIEGMDSIPSGTGLSITYDDSPGDSIDESTIGLYRWNEFDGIWQKLESSSVNQIKNKVSAAIYREGSFTLFAKGYNKDTTPPDPVDDLFAVPNGNGEYELNWTATGDDGQEGKALVYDIRWFERPINEANWDSCHVLPTTYPASTGIEEREVFKSSDTLNLTYFALKTADEAGNVSELSNVASAENMHKIENPAFALEVKKDHQHVDAVFIGKDVGASNAFDPHMDALSTAPESGVHEYIETENLEQLFTDYRNSSDTLIKWRLNLEFIDMPKDTFHLYWDQTVIPKDGHYYIDEFNMRDTSTILFDSDTSFIITYEDFADPYRIPDYIKDEDFEAFEINLKNHFHPDKSLMFDAHTISGNANLELRDDSILVIRSIPDWFGSSDIATIATDDVQETYQHIFNLEVNPVNDRPEFTSLPDTSVFVDSSYVYEPKFTDVDPSDSVYVSNISLPQWLVFDPSENKISGVPSNADIGSHQIEIIITDGMESTSQLYHLNVLQNSTSIEDIPKKIIRVYPNPAKNRLTIASAISGLEKGRISIYAINGTMVYRKDKAVIYPEKTINLSDFSEGTYILKIDFRNQTFTKEFVIEK